MAIGGRFNMNKLSTNETNCLGDTFKEMMENLGIQFLTEKFYYSHQKYKLMAKRTIN